MASSMMARSSAATQRSAFFGSKAIKAPATLVAKAPRTQVAAQALFGFLGGKKDSSAAASTYYICTACGYIYDGDFKTAPSSYKCPVCNVPKSKFKVFKGDVKGRVNNGGAAMKKRFEERQW